MATSKYLYFDSNNVSYYRDDVVFFNTSIGYFNLSQVPFKTGYNKFTGITASNSDGGSPCTGSYSTSAQVFGNFGRTLGNYGGDLPSTSSSPIFSTNSYTFGSSGNYSTCQFWHIPNYDYEGYGGTPWTIPAGTQMTLGYALGFFSSQYPASFSNIRVGAKILRAYWNGGCGASSWTVDSVLYDDYINSTLYSYSLPTNSGSWRYKTVLGTFNTTNSATFFTSDATTYFNALVVEPWISGGSSTTYFYALDGGATQITADNLTKESGADGHPGSFLSWTVPDTYSLTHTTDSSLKSTLSTTHGTSSVLRTDSDGFITGETKLDDYFITDVALVREVIPTSLFTWGDNSYGQLGNNGYSIQYSPVQTLMSGRQWLSVACGWRHTIGIDKNGYLWSWGANDSGQLGNNSSLGFGVGVSSPVQEITQSTWKHVSAGDRHTIAIKTDGTLWAWGANYNGQLGNNTTVARSSPVQVITGGSWSTTACGRGHTAAIKSDGTLWFFGGSSRGELMQNNGSYYSSPVQEITNSTWTDVKCNKYVTIGLKADGTVWGCGRNGDGELGDNSLIDRSSPVQWAVKTNDWAVISSGYKRTFAIKKDGTLWGTGTYALGLPSFFQGSSSPLQIGSDSDWSKVSSGYFYFSHAIKTDGTLWAWGENSGALGDGTGLARSTPVQIGTSVWRKTSGGKYGAAGIVD